MRDLGHAAAFHLETTIRPGDVIGISSWSATLLATVNAMHPVTGRDNIRVVQILGGVGNPAAEVHATQLTGRLADLLSGEPILLPVPGVVGSNEAREVLERGRTRPTCAQTVPRHHRRPGRHRDRAAIPLLARSGNIFSDDELDLVTRAGGVGDICLRFFDEHGRPTTERSRRPCHRPDARPAQTGTSFDRCRRRGTQGDSDQGSAERSTRQSPDHRPSDGGSVARLTSVRWHDQRELASRTHRTTIPRDHRQRLRRRPRRTHRAGPTLLSPSVEVTAVIGSQARAGDGWDASPERAVGEARTIVELTGRTGDVPVLAGSNRCPRRSRHAHRERPPSTAIIAARRCATTPACPLYVTCGAGLTADCQRLADRATNRTTVTLVWIGGSEHQGTS